MAEYHDPIQTLENFGTGGIVTAPLEPEAVRRLGDRRRTRRNAAVAVAAAAVVVAVVVPTALISGHGSDPTPAPPIATAPPTAPPTKAVVAKVVTYPGNGIFVSNAADTKKLTGTSHAFRLFIAQQAEAANVDGQACPGAAHGITVQKYSSAGYATGAYNACGGYVALWARSTVENGAWGEGQATQDEWDCDALTYLNVPTSFAGTCTDESGSFGTPGAGGAEPGMSKAQLTALGLTVSGPVAGADPTNCPGVEYGSSVLPSSTVGVYDAQDGLVNVAATASVKTAERVGLGTPRAQVLTAYPNGHFDASGDYIVPRPSATTFFIQFTDGRVAHLDWRLTPQHCGSWMQ